MTPETSTTTSARWSLLAALGAAIPFALTSVILPFGRDQGIYAYAADRFLHGDALYRDIYVFKPPLTVLVHAVALAVFGHAMTSIRLFDVFWTLATIAVLHTYVVRTTKSPLWAYLTSLCWAYTYHRFEWWNSAQTDGWANLPIALAFLLATPRDEEFDKSRPLAFFGAGVALGVAVMFKYTFALFAPWLALLPLLQRRQRALPDVLALGAGLLLAVAAVIGWLWAAGSLDQFIATQRDVTMPYSSIDRGTPLYDRLKLLGKRIGGLDAPALTGAVLTLPLLLYLWFKAPERRAAWRWATASLLVWTALAVTSGWVQKKMFPYHFLPLVAPMCVLAGGGVARVGEILAERTGRSWVPVLQGALLTGTLFCFPPFQTRWGPIWRVTTTDYTLEQRWYDANAHSKDTSTRTSLKMAAWIREHTQPDDHVFLWGYDPVIYFLADRELVSRFPYTYPLVVSFAPMSLREEFMASLNEDVPVVFGVASRDATPAVTMHKKDSRQTFKEFRRLERYVRDRFVLVAEIDTWRVFVRKDRAQGMPPLVEDPPPAEAPAAQP